MVGPHEDTRVGPEELFQALRGDSSQSPSRSADMENTRARATARGAEEPPEVGEMIKHMRIDAASQALNPLIVGYPNVPDGAV
jgi:hypothetical protein